MVEVKDSPAFLGNRIGFQFINEALRYAERLKDNSGIDYIDAILGSFTGRSMAPLTTSDFFAWMFIKPSWITSMRIPMTTPMRPLFFLSLSKS